MSEAFYQPTLSTEYELAWVKAGKPDGKLLSFRELGKILLKTDMNVLRTFGHNFRAYPFHTLENFSAI